jgi:hypothetical protein
MHTHTPEQHVRDLTARFADALHVKAPRVRVVKTSSGACYEALFNRIEIDERTLALPEPLLSMIVAHEVAHATQRAQMLRDFAWTGIGTVGLFFVPCYVFATSADDDFSRISVPALSFALAAMIGVKIMHPRAMKRAAALELDADAKAAQLCGVRCALQALEAMALRVHIEPARIDAMRARLVQTTQSPHE